MTKYIEIDIFPCPCFNYVIVGIFFFFLFFFIPLLLRIVGIFFSFFFSLLLRIVSYNSECEGILEGEGSKERAIVSFDYSLFEII